MDKATKRAPTHRDSKYYTKFQKGKVYKGNPGDGTEWIDKTGRLIDDPVGYDANDYFDPSGKYLGPDKYGIEPVKPR